MEEGTKLQLLLLIPFILLIILGMAFIIVNSFEVKEIIIYCEEHNGIYDGDKFMNHRCLIKENSSFVSYEIKKINNSIVLIK